MSKLHELKSKSIFESYGEIISKRLEGLGEKIASQAFMDILMVLQKYNSEHVHK